MRGITAVHFFDERYPPLLRLTPQPPAVLYYLGNLTPLHLPTMTIAGTREPSATGIQRARGSISLLAKVTSSFEKEAFKLPEPFGVISGLALGIDGIAHRAALDHGLYTAAVVGGGLDQRYPTQHRKLWDNILLAGGVIVSEQPFYFRQTTASLVQRDRIQSALSMVTYVVESSARGGSLHTARAALRQGRSLWLPSSLRETLSEFKQVSTFLSPLEVDPLLLISNLEIVFSPRVYTNPLF